MILKVPKEQAVFLYQLLESYDNLASYSTRSEDKGLGYREIVVHTTPGLREEFSIVLKHLAREVEFQVVPF